MNTVGPLIGTFGFFGILFLVGKLLQNNERRKRNCPRIERQLSLHEGEKIIIDQILQKYLDPNSHLLKKARTGQIGMGGFDELLGRDQIRNQIPPLDA